jgi:hypothetical protein
MTKWRSNRSISNLVEFKKRLNEQRKLNDGIAADKNEVPPWAKFEFDDKDWGNVNCHADLPDDARRALESAILIYEGRLLRSRPQNSKIRGELKRFAAKADALPMAYHNLSVSATTELIRSICRSPGGFESMRWDDEQKSFGCLAEVLRLRDRAAEAAQTIGRQHPGSDPRDLQWLVAAVATIYERHAKKPFKAFKHRKQFIFTLLQMWEIEVDTKNRRAIEEMIRTYRALALQLAKQLTLFSAARAGGTNAIL